MQPILFEIAFTETWNLTVSSYRFFGIIAALYMLFAVWYLLRRSLPLAKIGLVTFSAAAAFFLGSRLLYVILYPQQFINEPALLVYLQLSNFTLFGGFAAALLSWWLAARWQGLSFFTVTDHLAPHAGVAVAIMRVGCFLNGCCFGKLTTVSWGITFPAGSQAHLAQVLGNPLALFAPVKPVYPTQLYEIAAALLAALVAGLVLRYYKKEGLAAALFGLIFTTGRFIIFYFRDFPAADSFSNLIRGPVVYSFALIIFFVWIRKALLRGQIQEVSDMKQDWFSLRDGQQFGPLTWEQIWEEARSGKISSGDQVWNKELVNWVRADQVPGLTNIPEFATSAPPPPSKLIESGVPSLPASNAQKSQGGSKVALIIVAIIAVLALAGGGVFYFFLFDRAEPSVAVDQGLIVREELDPALTTPQNGEEIDYSGELGSNFPMGRGNTTGNIVNGGLAAEEDGWVYYRSNKGGALAKMHLSGGEPILLTADSAWFINVLGDWIFYSNRDDNNRLYRIKTDGTGRAAMTDSGAWFVTLKDQWVYYLDEGNDYAIYRTSTDGVGQWRLNEDSSWFINLSDDGWIYYVNRDSDDTVYRVRSNGGDGEQVNTNPSCCINLSDDGWIYYINEADRSRLSAMRPDGSGNRALNDRYSWFVNLSGENLYYADENDNFSLNRIKSDGSGASVISGEPVRYIVVVGDWIYYLNHADDDTIYKIKLDGSDRRLADDEF